MNPRREVFAAESAPGYRSDSRYPIGEPEDLACVELRDLLSAGVASRNAREQAAHAVLRGLKDKGVVLVKMDGADLPALGILATDGMTDGSALTAACTEIFARPDIVTGHHQALPVASAEVGFYSFPLNSPGGGVRGAALGGVHGGLPTSMIWNHCAAENPAVPEFESAQQQLTTACAMYCRLGNVIIDALSISMDDTDGALRRIAGPNASHRGNHLKLIRSPGAPDPGRLDIDSVTGKTCRHRAHVDHCLLTINPPTSAIPENGGRFYYLSADGQTRCWRPLEVPSGHVAIFPGMDMATFTRDTAYGIPGLLHQVLATRAEAQRDRTSALFRLATDPNSTRLSCLSGADFTFHGTPTPTGGQYYAAVRNHRRGY